MSALKLYEISNQFQALEQLGDSDELPAEVIHDTLEAIAGDFDFKAIEVAKFVLSLEANAAAVAAGAKAMAERASRIANRAASIKAYLQFHMLALHKKRIESADLVISRRANPPSVIVTDEHAIPPQFWVQPEPPPQRIDKKAIKAAIDAGMRVEGAFVEAGEHLSIRQ